MPLYQRDYDQAARYLRYACELLERQVAGKTTTIRDRLELAATRLSLGEQRTPVQFGVEVIALLDLAVALNMIEPMPADARTEILKAVSVLRDGAQ